MPTPPYDEDDLSHKTEFAKQRRAWKRDVFDNAFVDWKSIPAFEVTDHAHRHLLRNINLRCDSSRRRQTQLIASAREESLAPTSETTLEVDMASLRASEGSRSVESGKISIARDQDHTTVISDDEKIIDTIG
jgi:hypothetical protein